MSVNVSPSDHGRWSVMMNDSHAPWIYMALGDVEGGDSFMTNDMGLVKNKLSQVMGGYHLRVFQAIFPCDFPDNKGVGVSDVYQFTEGKTKKGEIFYSAYTRYGICRFGGPRVLMASEAHDSKSVLYERPRERQRYYGG